MDLKMEVYTPALELAGLLEVHRSIIWEEKAFSSGSFSVESLITDQSRTLLVPENIIWIAGDTAGVIEYVQQQAGQDGPYITVKGCDLTGLLARRILWGMYDLSGKVPDIMYRLVDDCCINPTRGDTEARKIPGLVLAEHGSFDWLPAIRAQKTGGALLEALEQLGEAYSVSFGVRFNPQVPRMEFWARPGVNRSVRQTVNEPVFYSTELDDVLSSEYAYNAQDYRNVALVAGEGEGGSRIMVVVTGGGEPEPGPGPGPEPPEPVLYTIALTVDPAGGGAAAGGGSVQGGSTVTVTAAPASGYEFAGWRENGAIVSTDTAYSFTASGDRSLTAVFAAVIPTYTITATVDPDGYGTVSGAGSYQEGASVTVTAAAGDGYKFTAWQENGQTVSDSESYTFTVTGDRELVAVFEEASRLPAGYTEVEYIKTVYQNCFETGFTLDGQADRVEVTFTPTTVQTSGSTVYSYYVLNTTKVKTRYFYLLYHKYYENTSQHIAWAANSSASLSFSFSPYSLFRNIKRTVVIDCPNKQVDPGVNATVQTGGISNTNEGQFENLILGYATGITSSSTSRTMIGEWYSFKVIRSGISVLDLVPCTDASGTPGFYDLVGKKFIGNTGSGTPTAGPAV